MTRPKVDPDKRQRTAQACDSCKRRKQKCNGLRPCLTCAKRNLTCSYGAPDNGSEEIQAPSPKRRMLDGVPNGLSTGSDDHQMHSPAVSQSPWTSSTVKGEFKGLPDTPRIVGSTPRPGFNLEREDEPKFTTSATNGGAAMESKGSTVDGNEEEAVVYSNTRMLQDPTGRLLYIGDSATLSFLQLIRMIVDTVAGPSSFTMDPRRHRIVENTISLPENIRRTHLLPDRQTANVLVDSYFTNVNGLVEVCHRKTFMATLDVTYTDPLNADPSWLCLLYLIFAIGLVMAAPIPGTPEDAIIQKLRNERYDRAEMFYSDAKQLADPSSGFEDAGFWSIQALTLMSVYMLAVSKRNAAYAYYGMAVRSAFALGLHREETMVIFSSAEQSVRRNLWRSLFVLDRFLATCLGRPTAIRESDCSGTTLQTGEKAPFPQAPFPTAANANYMSPSALGLEASVRSCHMIGVILEKVYSKRKISTRIAQDIADHCKGWPKALDPSLHYRQANAADPVQGIAILHVNLLHCHSVILLTRPFFLFLMNKVHQDRMEPAQRHEKGSSRMERFAGACVIASNHSITLVQTALENRCLPHRNPFVLYFLFAAALVVLANEFSALCDNPTANVSITNAINIMSYFAQQDSQGSRLLFILTSFRDVVIHQQTARSQHLSANQTPQAFMNAPPLPVTEDNDPMNSLFTPNGPFSPHTKTSAAAGPSTTEPNPAPAPTRHNSNPNISPLAQPAHPRRPSNVTSTFPTNNANTLNPDPCPTSLSLSRNNSLDAFLDLSRVNSHPNSSHDGNDSLGDAEIDFEALWQWPGSGLTPGVGTGLGSGGGLMGAGQGLGMLGGNGNGLMGNGGGGGGVDVQGISDSSVPLFGLNNAEFGGS